MQLSLTALWSAMQLSPTSLCFFQGSQVELALISGAAPRKGFMILGLLNRGASQGAGAQRQSNLLLRQPCRAQRVLELTSGGGAEDALWRTRSPES